MSQLIHYSLITCRISTVLFGIVLIFFITTILSLATYEVRSVIHFLQAKGNGAAQIHCRICAIYGNTVMSGGLLRD